MRTLSILSRLSVIFMSLFAFIIIGASFGYFQRFVGGDLLDMSLTGQEALQRLAEMSPSQKQAHSWITLIVDSLYPIAYGSFFIGATIKLAGHSKIWLLAPALLTVLADFTENIIQLLALNGLENFLIAKSIISPIKFSAFLATTLVLLVYTLRALVRKWKKRIKNRTG